MKATGRSAPRPVRGHAIFSIAAAFDGGPSNQGLWEPKGACGNRFFSPTDIMNLGLTPSGPGTESEICSHPLKASRDSMKRGFGRSQREIRSLARCTEREPRSQPVFLCVARKIPPRASPFTVVISGPVRGRGSNRPRPRPDPGSAQLPPGYNFASSETLQVMSKTDGLR